MEAEENDNVLFLKDKDVIVGYAIVANYVQCADVVYLQNICIDVDHRHKGYGSRFMTMIFDYIKDKYPLATAVYTAAVKKDDIANEFYQVNKFKVSALTYVRPIVREPVFTFSPEESVEK